MGHLKKVRRETRGSTGDKGTWAGRRDTRVQKEKTKDKPGCFEILQRAISMSKLIF